MFDHVLFLKQTKLSKMFIYSRLIFRPLSRKSFDFFICSSTNIARYRLFPQQKALRLPASASWLPWSPPTSPSTSVKFVNSRRVRRPIPSQFMNRSSSPLEVPWPRGSRPLLGWVSHTTSYTDLFQSSWLSASFACQDLLRVRIGVQSNGLTWPLCCTVTCCVCVLLLSSFYLRPLFLSSSHLSSWDQG